MKKVYLKDLQPDEIIRRLKAGEVFKEEKGNYEKKLIDGIICTIYANNKYIINDYLISNDETSYFEEQEELKLEVGKCYKTRDGRKAFIASKNNNSDYPFWGIIEGYTKGEIWQENGKYGALWKENRLDLISEWSDDDVAKD